MLHLQCRKNRKISIDSTVDPAKNFKELCTEYKDYRRVLFNFASRFIPAGLMRKLKNSELGRLNLEAYRKADKIPLIVILDDIRSLHNVGSVFRTADAFLIEKIYLCGITATPPNKEIHKTALGATDSVCWEYRKEILPLLAELRKNGVKIACVEQAENSIPLQTYKVARGEKLAVIFGNEVKGVDQKAVSDSDVCIEIPQFGTKHSLNVAVSCGIVLWDLFKQFKF